MHVLGIDLGTSSLKCVVMDQARQVHAIAEGAYPTQSPQPGWAEQDPADWLAALRAAIDDLRARERGLIDSVAAIGLCSAAHFSQFLGLIARKYDAQNFNGRGQAIADHCLVAVVLIS
jgi:xylulokinase